MALFIGNILALLKQKKGRLSDDYGFYENVLCAGEREDAAWKKYGGEMGST